VQQSSFMRNFKWRITLATVNLVGALWLSMVGMRQCDRDHALHPGYFYHGSLYYIPPAQMASYCWNMPAFVGSNFFRNVGMRYISPVNALFTREYFFRIYGGYYIAVVIFWWCVGRVLDDKSKADENANNKRANAGHVGNVIGILYGGSLLYGAIILASRGWSPLVMPASMIVWGAILVCFSIMRLGMNFSDFLRLRPS
jgi:hypothetical protein